VLIANGRHQAKFRDDAEHMRRNIGTARVVAEIFREFFFVALWRGKARLNRDPRHNADRDIEYYLPNRGALSK